MDRCGRGRGGGECFFFCILNFFLDQQSQVQALSPMEIFSATSSFVRQVRKRPNPLGEDSHSLAK